MLGKPENVRWCVGAHWLRICCRPDIDPKWPGDIDGLKTVPKPDHVERNLQHWSWEWLGWVDRCVWPVLSLVRILAAIVENPHAIPLGFWTCCFPPSALFSAFERPDYTTNISRSCLLSLKFDVVRPHVFLYVPIELCAIRFPLTAFAVALANSVYIFASKSFVSFLNSSSVHSFCIPTPVPALAPDAPPSPAGTVQSSTGGLFSCLARHSARDCWIMLLAAFSWASSSWSCSLLVCCLARICCRCGAMFSNAGWISSAESPSVNPIVLLCIPVHAPDRLRCSRGSLCRNCHISAPCECADACSRMVCSWTMAFMASWWFCCSDCQLFLQMAGVLTFSRELLLRLSA